MPRAWVAEIQAYLADCGVWVELLRASMRGAGAWVAEIHVYLADCGVWVELLRASLRGAGA